MDNKIEKKKVVPVSPKTEVNDIPPSIVTIKRVSPSLTTSSSSSTTTTTTPSNQPEPPILADGLSKTQQHHIDSLTPLATKFGTTASWVAVRPGGHRLDEGFACLCRECNSETAITRCHSCHVSAAPCFFHKVNWNVQPLVLNNTVSLKTCLKCRNRQRKSGAEKIAEKTGEKFKLLKEGKQSNKRKKLDNINTVSVTTNTTIMPGVTFFIDSSKTVQGQIHDILNNAFNQVEDRLKDLSAIEKEQAWVSLKKICIDRTAKM